MLDSEESRKQRARLANAKYRANHPERTKVLAKTRYNKNRQHIRQLQKQSELKHKDRIDAYEAAHIEERKGYAKKHHELHKKARAAKYKGRYDIYRAQYRLDNKDKIQSQSADYAIRTKEQRNQARQLRYRNNPNMRIGVVIRSRILAVLKGNNKSAKTFELLGCTFEQAKTHLETLFKPGMTWKNHGRKGWHIDHKIPCASFDLSQPEQQKICFNYTNLQPLWWFENLSKNDSLNFTP